CRPTCPSKRPKRENVAYFTATDDAEKQGFRACKRCKPEELGVTGDDATLIRRAIRHMDENQGGVDGLADAVGVSDRHLREVFSRTLGASPSAMAQAMRMNRLKKALGEGESVTNAIYDAGFGSASRLYENAQVKMGMSPATYAKGGKGAVIRYAITESRLGHVLMAATAHGVAALRLGGDVLSLEQDLQNEFHAATLKRDDGTLDPWLGAVVDYIERGVDLPRLPLDVIATAFQAKVWSALINIPKGMTASYADIAKAIGQPKSARAVGKACGSNGVALLVPCHRVIKGDGGLNGYRWGVGRKERLLSMEKDKP
ncbi:MAG: methylated-DNA--[protein]-cysteine S-methyltransferase, partial [Sphingomonadales bacterium]|nr:methylated-DNA--[protein]-cysteine S-methyltransferase [Sphingomonadales bacterium]